MPFTIAQQKALALTPKFTGSISIIGSLLVIRSIRIDMKNGEAGTYQRLLLGLSVADVFGSFSNAMSTMPIPKGTPGVWGAIGNQASCNFQGFTSALIVASCLYNGCLSVYFLLRSRYNWSNERLRKIEPLMHAIPIVNASVASIAGLPLKLYNSATLWCWIAPFPPGCKDSLRFGAEANCVRGDNAWLYRLVFLYGQVWASSIVVMVSMLLIYCTVRGHEKAVDKVQQDGQVIRRQSQRVAKQAFLYMLAFFFSWGVPSTVRLIQTIPGGKVRITFPLVLTMVLCLPIQGLWNCVIFFQGRFLKYRRDNPHNSLFDAIKHAVLNSEKLEGDTEVAQSVTDGIFRNAQKEVAEEDVVENS